MPSIDPEWLRIFELVRDLRVDGMTMESIRIYLMIHGVKLPEVE